MGKRTFWPAQSVKQRNQMQLGRRQSSNSPAPPAGPAPSIYRACTTALTRKRCNRTEEMRGQPQLCQASHFISLSNDSSSRSERKDLCGGPGGMGRELMSSEHLLCDRRPHHTTSSKPHTGFQLHTESSEARGGSRDGMRTLNSGVKALLPNCQAHRSNAVPTVRTTLGHPLLTHFYLPAS